MSEKDMGPFAGMDERLVDAISRCGTPPYRQMVTVSVRSISNYEFDSMPNTIDGWIELLQEASKQIPPEHRGAHSCTLSYDGGSYDDPGSARFAIDYERPETDEEMTERVNRGISYIRASQAQERATYEALKKKYASAP